MEVVGRAVQRSSVFVSLLLCLEILPFSKTFPAGYGFGATGHMQIILRALELLEWWKKTLETYARPEE